MTENDVTSEKETDQVITIWDEIALFGMLFLGAVGAAIMGYMVIG